MAKKVKKKTKVLLDTSIQIEKIKPGNSVQAYQTKTSSTEDWYTSHFVSYEFRTGFIRSLIDFHSLLEIKSPEDAVAKWSDTFSTRELKYFVILSSVLLQLAKKISTTDSKTEDYQRKVEGAIRYMLAVFDTGLVDHVGDFASNDIVQFSFNQEDSFYKFVELHNSQKIIELEAFWNKNKVLLDVLIADGKFTKKYDYFLKKLKAVQVDPSSLKNASINKGIGDAVIVADAPHTFTLLSIDHLFKILCEAGDRKYIILKKTGEVEETA